LGLRYKPGLTHAGSIREVVNHTIRRLAYRKQVLLPHELNGHDASQEKIDEEGYLWALRDVSVEVRPGEVVGIIGRNGAGQSTLLTILSRITLPTRGQVELNRWVSSLLEGGAGFLLEHSGREKVLLGRPGQLVSTVR
jgi:lipopolysaccharide transport system ATP-binding protein